MYILRFVSMIFYEFYSILSTFFTVIFTFRMFLYCLCYTAYYHYFLHLNLSIYTSLFHYYRSDNILDENDQVSPVSPFLRLSFVIFTWNNVIINPIKIEYK